MFVEDDTRSAMRPTLSSLLDFSSLYSGLIRQYRRGSSCTLAGRATTPIAFSVSRYSVSDTYSVREGLIGGGSIREIVSGY